MKCLKCGHISKLGLFCNQCKTVFSEKTAVNWKEIEEIKILIKECDNVRNLIIGNDEFIGMQIQMKQSESRMNAFFGEDFSKNFSSMGRTTLPRSSEEKIKDIESLDYIKTRLIYILEQLKTGQIIIPKQEISEMNDFTIELAKYGNPSDGSPLKFIYADVYEVLVFIKEKNENKNLLLFPTLLNSEALVIHNNMIINRNPSFNLEDLLTLNNVINHNITSDPIGKRFYLPYMEFCEPHKVDIKSDFITFDVQAMGESYPIETLRANAIERLTIQSHMQTLTKKYY